MPFLFAKTRKRLSARENSVHAERDVKEASLPKDVANRRSIYFETEMEAVEECMRIHKESAGRTISIRQRTPYGGYRVYSLPIELAVDELAKPIIPQIPGNIFARRK